MNPRLHFPVEFEPQTRSDWRRAVERALPDAANVDGAGGLESATFDGMSVPWLARGQVADSAQLDTPPGRPPYARGTRPESGAWQICQQYALPDPAGCNQAILHELRNGAEALWLRTGESGTRLEGLLELARVLHGVGLDEVPIYLEAGASTPEVASCFFALARGNKVELGALEGGLGFDPYGTLAATGLLPSGLAGSRRIVVDLATWCARRSPKVRALRVSGANLQQAGANACQQVGFAITNALAYLQLLGDADFSVNEAASQVEFEFEIGRDLFVDVAKLRAARLVWSRVLAALGAGDDAQKMKLHVRTAQRSQSCTEPEFNVVRGSAQAMAAVFGGADTLSILPWDDALGGSAPDARELALNTQHILRHEALLGAVADPMGGSGLVETLTDRVARAAWDVVREVESRGGFAAALVSGYVRSEINRERKRQHQLLESATAPIVGLTVAPTSRSQTQIEDDSGADTLRPPALAPSQTDDVAKRMQALAALAAASSGENYPYAAAVEAATQAATYSATVAELSEAWNDGRPALYIDPLKPLRDAALWENLRARAQRRLRAGVRPPRVLVIATDPSAAGATAFAAAHNALLTLGVKPKLLEQVLDPEELAQRFADSGADFGLLSGAAVRENLAEVVQALSDGGAERLIWMGAADEADVREAGIGYVVPPTGKLIDQVLVLQTCLEVRV